MKARLVHLALSVLGLLLAHSESLQAQPPQMAGGDGVASVPSMSISPYSMSSDPVGYGRFGYVPMTPHYQDGPARWAYDDLSGDRGGFYENTPMDEFVSDLIKDSFFRLEYLNWTFKPAGDARLGSATNAPINANGKYDQTVGNLFLGEARIADTGLLDIDHLDGLRATIGIPLVSGAIEANVFWFEDSEGATLINGLGQPGPNNLFQAPQFVGTSTLTNGQLGTNFFLYDVSFATRAVSRAWGSEINYLWDPTDPNPGFQLRPLIGFRYYDQDEDFAQIGTFNQQGALAIPLVSQILSSSANHIYAPHVGFRAEWVSRWLTIGVEPKLGFGVNDYESSTQVIQLRSFGDPTVTTREHGAKLATTGELGVFAKIHIHTNFSVTVGYQITFVDNITRPYDSIYYNDNGPLANPAVVTDSAFQLMYFQGINVGGELRF